MPSVRTDLAVLGGGPAGCAAALTLRAHAPAIDVTVIEGGDYSVARPGEVLPAPARALLERLGVMRRFAECDFVAGRALASAWASEVLAERHSIFSAQGPGWHLDRARFDRMLADCAGEAGAAVRTGTSARGVDPLGEGWIVTLADGATVEARALIWATGRNWRVARHLGARLTVHQSLAAHLRFYSGTAADCRTVIEACPDGWWYSSDLPGGRRAVACMTDPDVSTSHDLRSDDGWREALASTRHVASLLAGDASLVSAVVRSAGTSTLSPAAGRRWVAAGDTLFAADPLSSRGLVHALRSGMLAAYAVVDMLDGHEDRSRNRFTMIRDHGFASYAPTLAAYYAEAARRFDTPFWQRRRSEHGPPPAPGLATSP